jgi:hypothetical protein
MALAPEKSSGRSREVAIMEVIFPIPGSCDMSSGRKTTLAVVVIFLILGLSSVATCVEPSECRALADSGQYAYGAPDGPAGSGPRVFATGDEYWWDGFGLPGVGDPAWSASTVYALHTWNGFLAVGGDFYWAGGLLTGMVALWNGSAWNKLAQQIPYG